MFFQKFKKVHLLWILLFGIIFCKILSFINLFLGCFQLFLSDFQEKKKIYWGYSTITTSILNQFQPIPTILFHFKFKSHVFFATYPRWLSSYIQRHKEN